MFLFLLLLLFLISLFLLVDENENYVDDWCLGHLLQGMCYRCVNKPKEAMECLLNAVNRSVFGKILPPPPPPSLGTLNFFPHFRPRWRKLRKQKDSSLGGVYLKDTEILFDF